MSYGKVKETFWTDDAGKRHRVRPLGYRLRPSLSKPDAALRVFVFTRDDFTCQKCGQRPAVIPEHYDGKDTAFSWVGCMNGGKRTDLQLDHIVARSRGGSNHPKNIQTLCFPCNAGKGDRIAAE